MSESVLGKSIASKVQMANFLKSKNPSVAHSVLNMIPFYLSEGEVEGVRGDIAFAQSCLETGYFTFTGSAVSLSQNNFAGLGVTSNGMRGDSWNSPQEGIRAQIQHLKAYATTSPLIGTCVDTRYKYVSKGCAPYVEWLGIQENPQGKGWAAGKNYGEKILKIYNSILGIKESEGKSMRINVHAGHNANVPGASGILSETKENRNVKNLVISKLRAAGHTVYDCTDDNAQTVSNNLAAIVDKCNAHKVELDVSIHFNSFNTQAKGTEVFINKGDSAAEPYAQRIVDRIGELGYIKRGVKTNPSLYVLRRTSNPALLVECCFCDNASDVAKYSAEKMANAIVSGITGNVMVDNKPSDDTNNWIEDNGRWWYKHSDGSYTKDGWEQIQGQWYYFDSQGWMQTGWLNDNGTWYYLCGKGCMETGWQYVNGDWYLMGADGKMRNGWIQDGANWHYLNEAGKMQTGWLQLGDTWYYLYDSGIMATGLIDVAGKMYFLAEDGHMCYTDASGWLR